MKIKKYIPVSLIIFRFLLAPIIVSLVYFLGNEIRPIIVILMYLGLISDIFDGIIARKLNISTVKLRRADSFVDLFFWISIGYSSWLLNSDIIISYSLPIIFVFVMEASCYLLSILKFKKEACSHAISAKIWGITLLIAFTSLIGFGYGGIPLIIGIIMAYVCQTDRILIILILPRWTPDIPSFYHAYLIRKGVDIKRNKLFNG